MRQSTILLLLGVVCVLWPRPVTGHARLWTPPGRSTMWRRGFNTPANYDDNQLFCGGLNHQISVGYKCGVCGDPFDATDKPNEAPNGKYATGTLAETYTQGQETIFQVDVTANHKGYFEFQLCPVNDPKTDRVTPECLASHPVQLADGSGTKFKLDYYGKKVFDVPVRLPADLTCEFCVLQLRYHAGNNWGTDPDGTACLGCGKQEEFYGCSDIRITPASGSQGNSGGSGTNVVDPMPDGSPNTNGHTPDGAGPVKVTDAGAQTPKGTDSAGQWEGNSNSGSNSNHGSSGASNSNTKTTDWNSGPTATRRADVNGDQIVCEAISRQATNFWCQTNCQLGNCPGSMCRCKSGQYRHDTERPSGCRAAGVYVKVANMDDWCRNNCAMDHCPPSMCVCD